MLNDSQYYGPICLTCIYYTYSMGESWGCYKEKCGKELGYPEYKKDVRLNEE